MGRHGLNEITTSGDSGEPEKKFKPIAETYRKFTLAMVMGMMYPNPRTERRRLIYLLIISISFWPVYVMWFYDVFHCLQRLDVDNLTRQLSLGVPIMFCQFKMFLVTILRKKMQNLIEEINADYERYNCMDAGFQAIVMENQKSLLKLEKVWSYMVLATVAAFPLMALYQTAEHHLFKEGQRFMVHDVDVPWLKEQRFESPYFEILFVYMVYIALVLVLCYTAYDGMFFLCIFHACLKMKIISHQLMGALRDHHDVEQMKRNIAVVVEDQCETFRFVDRIREEYEFWLVQVFGLTGIQICMNMYQIITSDGSDIDPRYIIFFVAAILHIYVPCFLVSKLSATAAEVSNSAYCAGWEQVADSSVRRSIGIMIARAQIPVQVQALNMVTFNMELFVSVMQTSYSVFTLLRS